MKTTKPVQFFPVSALPALAAAAIAFAGFPAASRAQDEAFGPGTGGPPEMRGERGVPGPWGGRPGCKLSDEERQILKAAHEKIRKDAEIESLRKAVREQQEALRARVRQALIKADPRVEAILDKMEKGRPSREQMEKMRSVMGKIKDDPSVCAAREKMKAAKTPEERKAAGEELRAVMKTAVAKIDPELAEKMPLFPPMRGHGGPGKGGKGECRPEGREHGPGGKGTTEAPEPI